MNSKPNIGMQRTVTRLSDSIFSLFWQAMDALAFTSFFLASLCFAIKGVRIEPPQPDPVTEYGNTTKTI
jgi:hypothetical protein